MNPPQTLVSEISFSIAGAYLPRNMVVIRPGADTRGSHIVSSKLLRSLQWPGCLHVRQGGRATVLLLVQRHHQHGNAAAAHNSPSGIAHDRIFYRCPVAVFTDDQ